MKIYMFSILIGVMSLLVSCGDDIDPIHRDWVVENDGNEQYTDITLKDESVPMVHPGCLHNAEDISRVKNKVEQNASPWIDGWNKLMQNNHFDADGNPTVTPNPTVKIIRGGNTIWESERDNYTNASNQAHAAYYYAVAWKVSGDEKYATASINILNAWASVCQQISGDSNASLASGLYGYQFANAAELMRDYSGWDKEKFAAFQKWLIDVFYAGAHDFLVRHHGTTPLHYWANWGLANLATIMSIGIVTDRRDIYNEAVDHLLNGDTNGCLKNVIVHVFDGENAGLAQIQESGRDQGHSTLVIGLLGIIAQQAYNQGDDFFGYRDNVILKACEYVAKYNVAMLDVPFVEYHNPTFSEREEVHHYAISDAARGSTRTMYEVLYWHYSRIKNVEPKWMQYTMMGMDQMRPEDGPQSGSSGGAFDLLGYGTLMYPR